MAGTPLVSVVIDNYNYGHFLNDAISSVLDQTYGRTEVIVVDDGSTDNSRDVIASCGQRVISVLKENGGQGSAMNAGFAVSQGDIVVFLDADDLLFSPAVEQVVAVWRGGVAKVQFRLQVLDDGGRPRNRFIPPRPYLLPSGDLKKEILTRGFHSRPPTSGNAYARDVLQRILPMPVEQWRLGADTYLATWAPFCGEIVSIQEALGWYRIHQASLSRTTRRNSPARRVLYREGVYRLVKQIASEQGLNYSKELGREDPGYLKQRLASLVLDPPNHPIKEDKPSRLALWGVRAVWRYAESDFKSRVALSTWFVLVAFLPRRLARRPADWAIDVRTRPAWLRPLARYRSGRAS